MKYDDHGSSCRIASTISPPQASILDEIIQHKLDPHLFERQVDFIDCVRLLNDIIDSYPYDQQIVIVHFSLQRTADGYFQVYLVKLYERVFPYVTKTHEKLLTDEVSGASAIRLGCITSEIRFL